MEQYKNLDRVMETETILKNEASLKSQMSRGIFLLLMMMFFAAFMAKASDQSVSINGLATTTAIQNAIQNAINAAGSSGTVTVSGTSSGITNPLKLSIPTGVTVKWQASIIGNLGYWSTETLLNITGGIIEIADGSNIEQTGMYSGSALTSSGNVIVSGGTVSVSSSSGSVIEITGASSTVTVSGGTVTNNGYGKGINASGTSSTIIISGTGKVKGGSQYEAIYTSGNVEVKENAQVVAGSMGAIRAIGVNSKVIVSGGVVKYTGGDGNEAIHVPNNSNGTTVTVIGKGVVQTAGSGSPAIRTKGNVEVKDNAEISAPKGIAIYAEGASSTVTVSGGKVSATGSYYAIRVTGANSKIIISGGVVFAYEPAIAVNNENNFTGVSGTGVVIAWNQAAGNTSYIKGSANDLSMLPAGCAKWDKVSDTGGIAYENGINKGFIALDGITVTDAGSGIITPQTILLKVYPNPTTNIFFVDYEGFVQVRIFDMLGKEILTQNTIGKTEINISHLPKGIYNVSILSEGKIIGNSKIMKQ